MAFTIDYRSMAIPDFSSWGYRSVALAVDNSPIALVWCVKANWLVSTASIKLRSRVETLHQPVVHLLGSVQLLLEKLLSLRLVKLRLISHLRVVPKMRGS